MYKVVYYRLNQRAFKTFKTLGEALQFGNACPLKPFVSCIKYEKLLDMFKICRLASWYH